MPLRKSLSRKDICLNRFLMQRKMPCSGRKKKRHKDVKEEKQAPGFKAGRDRLRLLFCANAFGFVIRTALIYKASNPWPLERKDKHQLLVFWLYNKKPWTIRTLVLDWFHRCFVPEVKKYLDNKGLPFRVILVLDNAPDHPEPHEFNTEGVKVAYLPCKHISNLTSRSWIHKDL